MTLLNNSSILSNPAFKVSFTVRSFAAGSYGGNGVWTEGAPSERTASGSIQPVSGADMEYLRTALEGGAQITQAIRIYTREQLNPGKLGAQASGGDIVVHGGLEWSVVRLSDYSAHGHQKVFGVRIDGQNG